MDSKSLNQKLPYAFGDELDYFTALGEVLPERASVVMLGVGPAVMALALLEGVKDKQTSFLGVDNANFTGLIHLSEAGFGGRMSIFAGKSTVPAEVYDDNSVDLLIVDACHTYYCVKEDIEAWWRKVKTGGFVFFHDYVPQPNDAPGNGVKQAVEEARTLFWKEIAQPGCSIVFQKVD